MSENSTVHATAVLIGARAALIRGPAGAGKSRLALALLAAAERGALPFARLISDDRTFLDARSGMLLARPPADLAGLLEVRGLGIRRLPYESVAAIGLVVDLGEPAAARLPQELEVTLAGVRLPWLAVPPQADALALLLASLRTERHLTA